MKLGPRILDQVSSSFPPVVPNFQNASIRSLIDGDASLHQDEARNAWYNSTTVNKVLGENQNRPPPSIRFFRKSRTESSSAEYAMKLMEEKKE